MGNQTLPAMLKKTVQKLLLIITFLLTEIGVIGSALATEKNFSTLPAQAQTVISETLGGNRPEFTLIKTDAGYTAQNPVQQMTAIFNAKGMTIQHQEADWQFTLTHVGYGELLLPVEQASPKVSGNRIEYHRGTLTEWYLNSPLGVQQGYTLTVPPCVVRSADERLTLTMTLAGTGRTTVNADQHGLALNAPDGTTVLSYGGLMAFDANHRDLPATFMQQGDRLFVSVDDRNATYPIVIDPWVKDPENLSLALKSLVSDETNRFGESLDIDGDMIVVGDCGKTPYGAVYLFVRNPMGIWEVKKILTGEPQPDGSTAISTSFGASVAIAGNRIVVGAPMFRSEVGSSFQYTGAAYVFDRTGTLIATLLAPDLYRRGGDLFGTSVATDGDNIVIGAPGADIPALKIEPANPRGVCSIEHGEDGESCDEGAVYTFNSFGAFLAKYDRGPLAESNSKFGESVAIDQGVIVVGAPRANGAHQTPPPTLITEMEGAAYIYGNGGEIELTAKDAGATVRAFGSSVAINGETIVIGAPWSSITYRHDGLVYVFNRRGTSLTRLRSIHPEPYHNYNNPGETDSQFGTSVAIDGENLVVAECECGRHSHLFTGSGTTWIEQEVIKEAWARVNLHENTLVANNKARGYQGAYVFTPMGKLVVEKVPLTDYHNYQGFVTSEPPGIGCAQDCQNYYFPGTSVTLTATPQNGYVFTGWTGECCAGTGICTVAIDAKIAEQKVTAEFQRGYTLTVTKSGTGSGMITSAPAGISCGTDCSEVYARGTTVTLTAIPDPNSIFTGWSDACTGTGACTMTMNANKTVTASFEISVTPTPNATSTVKPTIRRQ